MKIFVSRKHQGTSRGLVPLRTPLAIPTGVLLMRATPTVVAVLRVLATSLLLLLLLLLSTLLFAAAILTGSLAGRWTTIVSSTLQLLSAKWRRGRLHTTKSTWCSLDFVPRAGGALAVVALEWVHGVTRCWRVSRAAQKVSVSESAL